MYGYAIVGQKTSGSPKITVEGDRNSLKLALNIYKNIYREKIEKTTIEEWGKEEEGGIDRKVRLHVT